MRKVDVQAAAVANRLPILEGIDPSTSTEAFGYLCVGSLVALPVSGIATFLDQSSDIEVQDELGIAFATLCFTTRLKEVVPDELTKWQYVAYLADAEISELDRPYTFRRDYLIVDASSAQTYIERYMDGAAVWGGFSHFTSPLKTHTRSLQSLRATETLSVPTAHHAEAFNRYILARSGFDRFLRLYHTIELIFDFIIMKKVQALGNDLHGFSLLMSSLENTEIERLKYVIREFCYDPAAVIDALDGILSYKSICTEMFQRFTKKGNPIADDGAWSKLWTLVSTQQLNEQTAKSCGLINKNLRYETFVYNVASYWIYRTRSSIAHSRVGEFLLKDSDEPFVVEVGERLLLEIVRQIFSSKELRKICT